MPFIIQFILVMISVCLADVCWTKYFVYVAKKEALKSAIWSALIVVCGIVSFISYMDDRRLTIAAVIGAFIGTYLTVKYSKETKNS